MAKGIVAFAFGMPAGISSNAAISRIASGMALEHGAPVLTQRGLVSVAPGIDVSYVDERPDLPASTLEIAFQAIGWAQERGIEQMVVVCAKPHLWRCLRDLQYAIRKSGRTMALTVAPEVHTTPDEVWFCPKSTQGFHRSRARWNVMDFFMRRVPMPVYVKIYSRLRRKFAP